MRGSRKEEIFDKVIIVNFYIVALMLFPYKLSKILELKGHVK